MSKRNTSNTNLRDEAVPTASEEAPTEDKSPTVRVGVKNLRAKAAEFRVQAEAAQNLEKGRRNKKRRKSDLAANPDLSNDDYSSTSEADSKSEPEDGEVEESTHSKSKYLFRAI